MSKPTTEAMAEAMRKVAARKQPVKGTSRPVYRKEAAAFGSRAMAKDPFEVLAHRL